MKDDLWQKLEEKIMSLISELETVRKELKNSQQENISLKTEKSVSTKKLQELVSLLDTLDIHSEVPLNSDYMTA